MTLPVRRAVIRPSFASIADTLREEFANKGLRLYENIYIDYVIVKCRPRGVYGIYITKLEGAKRPSAEWSKSRRHRLVGI